MPGYTYMKTQSLALLIWLNSLAGEKQQINIVAMDASTKSSKHTVHMSM